MPFGFVGTAAFLIAVAAATPLAYVFVWPGGVSRTALFLTIAIAVAVVAGVISFLWNIAPLQDVGISGQVNSNTAGSNLLESQLQWRFYIAAGALVLSQAIICRSLDAILSR